MNLAFKFFEEAELPWPVGETPWNDNSEAPAPAGQPYRRSIDPFGRAAAARALSFSDLRRLMQQYAHVAATFDGEPADACGGEDSSCSSFLDRYLGAGVEPCCDEADLFPAGPPA